MTFTRIALGVVALGSCVFVSRAADPVAPPDEQPIATTNEIAEPASPPSGGEGRDAKTEASKAREGTRWQGQRGFFTLVGDRATFTADRGTTVVVLENLNLERIVRTIEESRTVAADDKLEWLIDGTLTEYRGGNFLFISRSVLVTRPKKADAVR